MSNSNEKQYYLEISRHTMHAVRTSGGMIEFCQECAIDQKGAVDATLASWSSGVRVRAVTSVLPSQTLWHLSTAEETPSHRTEASLRAFAAALPHGFAGPVEFTACLADDGSIVGPGGKTRWLLGVVSADKLAESVASAGNLDVFRLESATLARIGGIVAAVRQGASGPVLLWELGVDRSHLLLVTARGVETVVPCAVGLDALFGAVQTALGLKMRGAAARLFFNDNYDFGETAERIVADLAPVLKGASAGVPATALACLGLTSKQAWFTRAMARGVGLEPFAPDMAKLVSYLQLRSAPDLAPLTPETLGLLHTVSSQIRQTGAWHPTWSRPGSGPSVIEKPAAASAPAKSSPGSGASFSATVIKAVTVADRPSPASHPVPAVAVAVLPAIRPEIKPAPVIAPVKGVVRVTPNVQGNTGRKTEAPTVKPNTPPASPPTKYAPLSVAAPAPAGKRSRNIGLYLGLAAGLVFAALAGKFYFDAQAAQQAAVREKASATEQIHSAAARVEEMQKQSKADAERIRREAEAARESAVALASQQAEQQTRQKISAELDAARLAKLPGILIVTTSPVGANVSIDGGPVQPSPLSLNDLAPGNHQVSVSLSGYDPVELTAAISAAKTTDLGMIQLARNTGVLAITSTPDQLEFIVRSAGVATDVPLHKGRTPAQFEDLPPGDYLVTFLRPGWHEQTTSVSVAKRARAETSGKFTGGALFLTSSPSGAVVERSGAVVGTTPLTLTEMPPGSFSYKLTLANYDPVTISGDIVEGKDLRLEARLLTVDHIASGTEIANPMVAIEQPAPTVFTSNSIKLLVVKMSFVVWRDGTVRDVKVVGKVDRKVAAGCVEAVSKWKFRPATNREGHPLNVRVEQTLEIREQSV